MERSTNRRARCITLVSVVVSVVLSGTLGQPVHADDEPVADPPVAVGELDGAVVAVGLPPVPPTSVVVAVGLPPVPPTRVVVAVGLPPVPPTTLAVVPDQPASPANRSDRVSDQRPSALAAQRPVEVAVELVDLVDLIDVIADMVATVEAAVALVDSRL